MKKFIFFSLLVLSLSCNSKTDKAKETVSDTANKEATRIDTTGKTEDTPPVPELYACSMHPEVKGKKNDKCPKCGMFLDVPVVDTTIRR